MFRLSSTLSSHLHVTSYYAGLFWDFDHFKLAREAGLDLATWDNYPLGQLDSNAFFSDADKARYARTGHPDLQSFHHALYRAVGGAGVRRAMAAPTTQSPPKLTWLFAPFCFHSYSSARHWDHGESWNSSLGPSTGHHTIPLQPPVKSVYGRTKSLPVPVSHSHITQLLSNRRPVDFDLCPSFR